MKMKKIMVLLLTAVLLSLTACGNKDIKEEAKEAAEQTDTQEITGDAENAETEKEAIPYAEEKDLKFGSFSPMSMDYDYNLVNLDTYDEVNNEDFHVIDKGSADYFFYSVTTYPSGKEGYTTAKITYLTNFISKIHGKYEGGDRLSGHSLVQTVYPFDYYTGLYIPEYEVSTHANETGQTVKTEGPETQIDFNGKKWSLKAMQESCYSRWNAYRFSDSDHYDMDDNTEHINSLYVTYPSDYDGLSFAINTNYKAKEYDKEEKKKSYEGGEKNEDIGKDILEAFADVPREDILFCTMKKPESINPSQAASEEETMIPSYIDRQIAGNEFNDAGEASDFSIPYDFTLYGEDGKVLSESDGNAEYGYGIYSISDVSAEDQENGDLKISLVFKGKMDVPVNVSESYEKEFYGWCTVPEIQVFNGYTGSALEVTDNVDKNEGEWGDWEGDTRLSYHQVFSETAEFTMPADEKDNTVLLIGDRKSSSHVMFRVTELAF